MTPFANKIFAKVLQKDTVPMIRPSASKIIDAFLRASSLLVIILSSTGVTHGQNDAHELIQKSISYHDPHGLLDKKEARFHFTETRPNSANRNTTVVLHPKKESFMMVRNIDNQTVITEWHEGNYRYSIDDSDPTNEQIETYRLTDDRSDIMRNYYHYLWYMPMKLLDPGTIIDPQFEQVDFFGTESYQIRVSYDSSVGEDVWYFYFDTVSYALVGYRFYHDEAANDGEYILLDGETVSQTLRIPKSRTWYTHKDDKILGTDILDRLTIK